MKQLLFAKSHEWAEVNGDLARVGISDYAQNELGDIVYIELPQVGDVVEVGQPFANVESVKAVSEVYSPVSGEVTAVNDEIDSAPETVNADAENAWFIEVRVTAVGDDLLSKEDYLKTL